MYVETEGHRENGEQGYVGRGVPPASHLHLVPAPVVVLAENRAAETAVYLDRRLARARFLFSATSRLVARRWAGVLPRESLRPDRVLALFLRVAVVFFFLRDFRVVEARRGLRRLTAAWLAMVCSAFP